MRKKSERIYQNSSLKTIFLHVSRMFECSLLARLTIGEEKYFIYYALVNRH